MLTYFKFSYNTIPKKGVVMEISHYEREKPNNHEYNAKYICLCSPKVGTYIAPDVLLK